MTLPRRATRGLALSTLLMALAGAAPLGHAQDKTTPAPQESRMHIEKADTIAAVLARLEGQPVRLRLAGNGEELSGKLVSVGQNVAHLSNLSGRDFFDAVVRIDQIAAVVAQVRGR